MGRLKEQLAEKNEKRERFSDRVWDLLQFWYVLIGNYEGVTPGKSWTRQKRKWARTGIFFFLFVYMIYVSNHRLYEDGAYAKYHSLVFAISLLLLAWLSGEAKLVQSNWNSSIARCYLIFWLLVCVSDFVMDKRFVFLGYLMLLIAGLFFLVWEQMEHPEDICWDFLHALELFAAAGAVYNMFFRFKYGGLLYNGYMRAASDFGMFSAFVVLAFLIEIYECQKTGNYGKKLAFCACGAAISTMNTLLSGKKIAVLYAVILLAAALLWPIRSWIKTMSGKEKKKLAMYLLLAFFSVCVYYFSVKYIPWKLQTMVSYEKETFVSRKDPSAIAALSQTGIEAYQNVEFDAAEQKIRIWKAYLKKSSLFGHKQPNLKVLGKRRPAENYILQILYRYGIFVVIPYVLMFCMTFLRAVKNLRKKKREAHSLDIFDAGALLFWLAVGFFGNLEQPYFQPAWIWAYFTVGKHMRAGQSCV